MIAVSEAYLLFKRLKKSLCSLVLYATIYIMVGGEAAPTIREIKKMEDIKVRAIDEHIEGGGKVHLQTSFCPDLVWMRLEEDEDSAEPSCVSIDITIAQAKEMFKLGRVPGFDPELSCPYFRGLVAENGCGFVRCALKNDVYE